MAHLASDFLPYKCNSCDGVFCHQHYGAAAHACPEAYKRNIQTPACPLCASLVSFKPGEDPNLAMEAHISGGCKPPASIKHKTYCNLCSLPGCKKHEAIPVLCHSCKRNFCLQHRFEKDHSCTGATQSQTSRSSITSATANAALARHSPQQKQSRPTQQPKLPAASLNQLGRNLQQSRDARNSQRQMSHPALSEEDQLAQAIAASLREDGYGLTCQSAPWSAIVFTTHSYFFLYLPLLPLGSRYRAICASLFLFPPFQGAHTPSLPSPAAAVSIF